MLLLGLTGYAQHGKDTTAQILTEYGFVRYGFADALRQMARAIDPTISLAGAPLATRVALARAGYRPFGSLSYVALCDAIGYDRAKLIPGMRRFLQRLGTEGVRNTFGERAWISALERRLDRDQPKRAVISDVRFENEASFINARGGFLWRITRLGHYKDTAHPSESAIADLVVDDDILAGTLDVLSTEVHTAVARHFPYVR